MALPLSEQSHEIHNIDNLCLRKYKRLLFTETDTLFFYEWLAITYVSNLIVLGKKSTVWHKNNTNIRLKAYNAYIHKSIDTVSG